MKMNWIILSLIALFSFSAMSFLIVFLTRRGHPVSFVLLGIAIVLLLFYSVQTFILSSERPQLTFGIVGLIIFIGTLAAVGNLASFQAANDAPNPGLAFAIGALSSGVVALLAFFIFKDKLSTLQIIGLVLALISVTLIAVGSNKSKNDSTINKTDLPIQVDKDNSIV